MFGSFIGIIYLSYSCVFIFIFIYKIWVQYVSYQIQSFDILLRLLICVLPITNILNTIIS